MKKLIQKIIPFDDLKETILRFPLSVFCALVLFVMSIVCVYGFKEEWLWKLSVVLGLYYFWFGISKLISESQGWKVSRSLLISFVVAGAMAGLIFFSDLWAINLIFVVPALLLTLMVAPYLTSGDDISVWFFNRMTWFGVVVSYAALLMFAGGLSVALFAIDKLFDVNIGGRVYFDIWLFSSLVLGPVYALSWIPKIFEFSDDDCHDPAGLKFIVNWISVPMVFVYLLILYAYFIKIIVTGEIPNGHLAYMITGFAGAGIVTYLVAHPLRNEGSLQLRLFYKIFFPALLIPVGFHFYAIWERISAYGVTEQRYLILISAIWFLLMAVSNSISKLPIKAIPASLAILMIFASFGPWGGVAVSGYSQVSRLESLLIKNDLLVDGKVAKTEETISFDDRKSISSILDYLCRSDRDAMIEPWFSTENNEDWKCNAYNITENNLGFDYVSNYSVDYGNSFDVWGIKNSLIEIGNYDFLLQNQSVYLNDKSDDDKIEPNCVLKDKSKLWVFLNKKGDLVFKIQDDVVLRYNMVDFIRLNKEYKNIKKPLFIDLDNDIISMRIYISGFSGAIDDDALKISNMSFDLLFTLKE